MNKLILSSSGWLIMKLCSSPHTIFYGTTSLAEETRQEIYALDSRISHKPSQLISLDEPEATVYN